MATTSARLIIPIVILITAYHASAYIPTAEQVLGRTVIAYRHLKTMEAFFTSTVFDASRPEEQSTATEHMYVKGSNWFRAERLLPSGRELIVGKERKARAAVNDPSKVNIHHLETVFPLICFHASVDTLIDDLNYLGVDTNIVAFDRMHETVAFVMGKGDLQAPGSRVWIDKERGLPLRFTGISTVGEKRVVLTVEYVTYTQVAEKYWLPSQIDYYMNDMILASSTLTKMSINQPLENTPFDIPDDRVTYLPVASFLSVKE
jgi:outer membrane lipoprotein-sorting protein